MPEQGKVRMSIWVEPEDRERLRYRRNASDWGRKAGRQFAVHA